MSPLLATEDDFPDRTAEESSLPHRPCVRSVWIADKRYFMFDGPCSTLRVRTEIAHAAAMWSPHRSARVFFTPLSDGAEERRDRQVLSGRNLTMEEAVSVCRTALPRRPAKLSDAGLLRSRRSDRVTIRKTKTRHSLTAAISSAASRMLPPPSSYNRIAAPLPAA
jgi:hypothetical protein